jgi:hypothetical protein
MIAIRLVRLIEAHSDDLARSLMEKLQTSTQLEDLHRVPREELEGRVKEIYGNLCNWLVRKTERDIERRYLSIGMRRAAQGVRLSTVIFAILATKEHLWEFLEREGLVDRPLELFQEIELLRLVEKFFDRAVYYAARGYEMAEKSRAA